MKVALALATTLALTAGCWRTTYLLAPPGQMTQTSAAYDQHMHWSLINVIELSSPVNLQLACNNAPPVAIEENVGVLGALINIVLDSYLPILHVHNATVLCPAGPPMQMGQPPMGAPMGQPPMGPPPGQPPMAPPPAQ